MIRFIPVLILLLIASCTGSEEKRKADSEIYLEIAVEYMGSRDYEKAIQEADNALKAYPSNIAAYFVKAEVYGLSGKYDDAERSVEDAAKSPGYSKDQEYLIEHWRGVVNYHKENYQDALSHLEKSASLRPDYALNRQLLSQLYMKVDDLEKGIENGVLWAELAEDDPKAWENLGLLHVSAKKFTEAKAALDKALSIDPKSPLAYNYFGRWAEEQGMLKDAEEFYLKSIELNGNISFSNLNLGQLYMRLGKTEEAFGYLKKANEIDPRIKFAHYWLGRYYLGKKDFPNGYFHFMEAVKLDDKFSPARAGVAELCYRWGEKLDEAISVVNEGLARNPDEARGYYYYLAMLNLASGNLEKAAEFTDRSKSLLKETETEGLADLHLLKGKIHLKRGDKKGAKEEFRAALTLAPATETGREARQLLN